LYIPAYSEFHLGDIHRLFNYLAVERQRPAQQANAQYEAHKQSHRQNRACCYPSAQRSESPWEFGSARKG
jgi:hypothetical protein